MNFADHYNLLPVHLSSLKMTDEVMLMNKEMKNRYKKIINELTTKTEEMEKKYLVIESEKKELKDHIKATF